jgi:predicted transcriptional regulator
MDNPTFEQIIKDLREASYTDVQIAKLCDCSNQYIGKIGRGQVKNVRYSIGLKLTKLHEALQ